MVNIANLLKDKRNLWKIDEEAKNALRATANSNKVEAFKAQDALASQLGSVIQEGLFAGDINLFQPNPVDADGYIEYPIDFIVPGTENEYTAFTMPDLARIPERQVTSDRVMVKTYPIANAIDWSLRYARQARWDIVARAIQVLRAGFVKKINDDGWHTILAAANNRGLLTYDSNAANGQFTLRLISLMKTVMVRKGGGNVQTGGRFRMTDLFVSPEAIEDIRNWTDAQIDDITKHDILRSPDGTISQVYGVNIRDLTEFGVGQEYQKYLVDVLGASMNGSDTEFCIGVDLSKSESLVMPVSQNVEVTFDESMHRRGKEGYYARMEVGFGVLDNRVCLLGSF